MTFYLSERSEDSTSSPVSIVFDGPAVRERLMRIVEDEDLRKYIL